MDRRPNHGNYPFLPVYPLFTDRFYRDVVLDLDLSPPPQEKLLTELKRKRDKSAKQLKEARAAQKDAEKRCRLLEEEKEAICDDYESRLQQQVRFYFRWDIQHGHDHPPPPRLDLC